MDMNYLVQRRINAKKRYRRKVTLAIGLGIILLVLILIGLVKIIIDEKNSKDNTGETGKNVSENLTPGATTGAPSQNESGGGEDASQTQQGNGEINSTPLPTATLSPTATATLEPTRTATKKVAIDPGHGGPKDLGSPRPDEGIYEKNANLAIALFLKEELLDRGYEVYMIREADVAVENKERPGLALANGADIYVSIHLNSLEKDSDATQGAEVWYANLRDDGSDKLAQYVVDELTAVTGTRNRGIKLSNNLIVLKYNELPACLVECGFMSSAPERAKLFDPEYQKKIAEGVANGIEKFLPLE